MNFMSKSTIQDFLDMLNIPEEECFDFEYGIALETTHFYYDESDNDTLSDFRVTRADIKEHVFKNHDRPTFANLAHAKKSKYLSYFSTYYLNHVDDVVKMVRNAVISNSDIILDFIRNSDEERFTFMHSFPKEIGYVIEKNNRVENTDILFVCIGIDREESFIYLVTAFPVLPDYKPEKVKKEK